MSAASAGAAQKQILLGAFEVMSPSFLTHAWSHPQSHVEGFDTLEYWQDLATQLDAGGFDFLFFADISGYAMVEDWIPEVVVRESVNFPVLDQLSLISGLAAVAQRLGFVVTASTTIDRPFVQARRFSTLDHLTKGRIGWNIVTSDTQESLKKLLGEKEVIPHDARYDMAEEYVNLCLKLWEEAWEDGGVRFDKPRRIAIDPAKVHRMRHAGEHFSFDGFYTVNPSPQRTPALFQAGSSPRGVKFAADFAECTFIQKRDIPAAKKAVQTLRDAAEAAGRVRDSLKIVNSITVVVGDTEEEAQQLLNELKTSPSAEAVAAQYMSWSGLNLLGLDPDQTLEGQATESGHAAAAKYQRGEDSPTVREILEDIVENTGGFKIAGTPEQIVQRLEVILTETGVDGFMLERTLGGTTSHARFIAEVMPLLRERGLVPPEPRTGTLRERIRGPLA